MGNLRRGIAGAILSFLAAVWTASGAHAQSTPDCLIDDVGGALVNFCAYAVDAVWDVPGAREVVPFRPGQRGAPPKYADRSPVLVCPTFSPRQGVLFEEGRPIGCRDWQGKGPEERAQAAAEAEAKARAQAQAQAQVCTFRGASMRADCSARRYTCTRTDFPGDEYMCRIYLQECRDWGCETWTNPKCGHGKTWLSNADLDRLHIAHRVGPGGSNDGRCWDNRAKTEARCDFETFTWEGLRCCAKGSNGRCNDSHGGIGCCNM